MDNSIEKNLQPALFLFGTLEVGGSETKFVRMANRWVSQGLPIHIAYLRGPEALLDQIDGVPTIHLERKGKWSPAAYRNLANYVKQQGVASIICVNLYPLTYAVPLAKFGKGLAPKVLVSVNTSEFVSERERCFMKFYAGFLRTCDHVIYGSKSQRAAWSQSFRLSGIPSSVIYNGVDAEYFDPNQELGQGKSLREKMSIDSGAFVIVCVSQLRPEKAHENLIGALSILDKEINFRPVVLFVGDGVERETLMTSVAKAGLRDRVHFCGVVSDVRPYLQAADVFALTSTAVETFSNAALEASAMGLPVVISDVGGAHEMFPPDSEGVVYPRNDIRALADALVMTAEKSRQSAISRQSVREKVVGRFSTDSMDRSWQQLIWKDFNALTGDSVKTR